MRSTVTGTTRSIRPRHVHNHVITLQSLTDWGRRLVSSDYCGRVYVFAGDWATFEFLAREMLPDLEILNTDLAIAKTLRDLQRARQSERQD